nr:MLO-like protein 3 [Ipomoea batatas]
MWLLVVIFLLADVHGWNVYLWVSFLPLIIVLVVGTKLEVIVAKMALRVKNQSTVIKGSPLVQPNDNLFWFNHPPLVLTLLHFTLFMNAFEVAFFIWVTLQFGIRSCYHENVEKIVIRVVLAVMVQILCSYITLPLYALVTQMGSHYKRALLEENVMQIIKYWHSEVKKKKNRNKKNKNMAGDDDEDIENSRREYYSSSTTPAAVSPSSNSPETSHLNRSPTLAPAAAETDDEITEEWRPPQ